MVLNDKSEINITAEQKEAVTGWINDKIPFIEIFDVDTKEEIFSWKSFKIDYIKRRKFSNVGYNVVCDYWERHSVFEWEYECSCQKKMWLYFTDSITAINTLWHNVNYPQDITKEMRQKLYKEIRKEDFKDRVREYIRLRKETKNIIN